MKAVLWFVAIGLGLVLLAPGQTRAGDDPFEEGSKWEGTRLMGPKKIKQEWSIRITKRKDNTFEGEMTLPTAGDDKELKVNIKGTAPAKGDGVFKFETDKKGGFKQKFTGRLKGGTVSGDFTGIDVFGKSIGTASAKLDPK